ncbi:hypothetical protein JCM13267_00420 [Howardella ureilytica]
MVNMGYNGDIPDILTCTHYFVLSDSDQFVYRLFLIICNITVQKNITFTFYHNITVYAINIIFVKENS